MGVDSLWFIARLQRALEVSSMRVVPLGGGCIANAARLETNSNSWFLKYGTNTVAESLVSEYNGLILLRSAKHSLTVPEPVCLLHDVEKRRSALVLSWLDETPPTRLYWEKLGRGLAQLHRKNTSEEFGLSETNFIGSTPQENNPDSSWRQFFVDRRLDPMVDRLKSKHRWVSSWDTMYKSLLNRLDELLPDNPPASLLHGDLWSGNALCHGDSRPAIIDPAVYYGHRETDLAMTELFGGFSSTFYDAYRAEWPLDPGYDERKIMYNLYHALNHLLLFGGGYSRMVEQSFAFFA